MTERHPVLLTGVLAGVQLLAVLDSLAAALALPAIAADLGLGAAGRAWVLNATSVALAGGLLVAGRFGDLVGRRRVFLVGLVLLGIGSVVCATAPTPVVLLVGRALLGLGAAVSYPSALSLTSSLFPRDPWRGRAFTAGAIAGASGSIGGAVYGGLVTGLLGWRWVFWLTVPVTVALLVAAYRLLPVDADVDRTRRLDLPGAVLATLAVTGLVAGIIGVGTASMALTVVLVVLGLALLAGAALVAWERGRSDPLLPGRVVRRPRLLGGFAGQAANSALWSVVVFVLAQQLQAAGWSPAEAGAAILPASLGIVLASFFVVPWLRRRFGSVRAAVAGLLASAACVAVLALAPERPSFPVHLLVPLLVLGAGLNATHTSLNEHTLKDSVDGAEAVSAAVLESSNHVGGALAVALYAAVLATGSYGPAYLVAAAAGVGGAVAAALLSGRPEERLEDRPGGLRPGLAHVDKDADG